MNKLDNNFIRTFFQWWIEQLATFVPPYLKAKIEKNKNAVEITISEGEWVLSVQGKGADLPNHASINAKNEHCSELLKTWLTEQPNPPSRLKITIPNDYYLLREIELPLAAETTLHEALEFQIERITPFRLEDIYYHYGVKERDRVKKVLKVWIAVIAKQKINPILTAFDNLSPQQLTPSLSAATEDENAETFTISYRLKTEENNDSRLKIIVIALLVINLLALAIYANLHLNNLLLQTEALHTQLKEVKSQALEAMDIKQLLEEQEQQAEFIESLGHAALMKVAIIDDLTNIIPDHTWIKQLDIKDGKLTLAGYSDNSAGLIGQLEKSPYLLNVGFKSTVIRDRISGKERFTLSATLTNPEILKTDNSERDKNADKPANWP